MDLTFLVLALEIRLKYLDIAWIRAESATTEMHISGQE